MSKQPTDPNVTRGDNDLDITQQSHDINTEPTSNQAPTGGEPTITARQRLQEQMDFDATRPMHSSEGTRLMVREPPLPTLAPKPL